MNENPLNDLHRDAAAPPELRHRIEETLRARGLIASHRAFRWRRLRAAGLLAAALVLGFVAGRANASPWSDTPRYLLLLYEDSTYRDDRPAAEIVGEYARWADSLRRRGDLVLGEKLAAGAVTLHREGATASTDSPGSPTGLFVIRADGDVEARTIAQTSPHLRYGGRIELRAIETGSDR